MKKSLYSLIIIITCAIIFISCGNRPSKIVKEYEQAYNSHDVNKLVSLFSDSAVIELTPINKLKGLSQIKGYTEFDSVLNSHITISDITESNGRAFFVVNKENDFLKTIGIDSAKYSMIFNIDGGKIVNISGSTTVETDNKFKEFQNPFMLWAARERLDVLNELMPGGSIVYNAKNAKKYLELVFEWKRNNIPALIKPPEGKKTGSYK